MTMSTEQTHLTITESETTRRCEWYDCTEAATVRVPGGRPSDVARDDDGGYYCAWCAPVATEMVAEAAAEEAIDCDDDCTCSDHGDLCDYGTAAPIRGATAADQRESREQARRDGGAGVIVRDGRRVYVQD